MLRKLISYLVIFSILFVDGASCMLEGAGDKQPPLHRRRLSDGDIQSNLPRHAHKRHNSSGDLQPNNQNPLPRGVEEAHEDNASQLDRQAPQPPSPLPQGGPTLVPPPSAEGEEEDIESIVPFEQNDDDFVILEGLGSQLILNHMGGSSHAEDLLNKETLAQKYLQLLGINFRAFTLQQQRDLETILRVETTWRNWNWANFAIPFHKFLFALTTNKSAVNERKQKKRCDPLWLYGGPVPLENRAAILRNIFLKTFGNSLEEGVIESFHAILLALLGYQIHETVQSGQWAMDGSFIATFYSESDTTSYLGIIRTLNAHPGLFALLGVPLAFATAKALYYYLQISEPNDEAINNDINTLRNRSHIWDWWGFNFFYAVPVVSSLSTLHPMKRNIATLTSVILWEGNLSPDARQNAFTALRELAQNRRGLTQMAAIESLAHLTHGMHIKNLLLRPHDVDGLVHIKVDAFHALKEIYVDLPWLSLNKFRTAVLLWEIGQSPSWVVSFVEPVIKAFRAALYGYMLYGIIDVLYEYFSCPAKYLNNFSWDVLGGLPPSASKYSSKCFDAQGAVFNTLPGQPAYTLVGDLARYHFTGPYDLKLSGKFIQGDVIADIVEAFQKERIPLKSLDVSFNAITNSSDIARILRALSPDIVHLDLSNINYGLGFSFESSSDFSGLAQLTGLQSFSISNNGLDGDDVEVIGKALRNHFRLKELRLAGNVNSVQGTTNIMHLAQSFKPSLTLLDLTGLILANDPEGQIALGKSFLNLTLKELYLGETGIGWYDQTNRNTTLQDAAIIVVAQGLSAQQELLVLDLSYNELGTFGKTSKNSTFLLSSLPPSLTHLDVSQNWIGVQDFFEVKALAQAVEQMSELTSFKAGGGVFPIGNTLGGSPDFLKALQGKQNLTELDLSWNSCNDSTLIRELLLTIPNLETLNLSYNQLTNGSMLAPVLSTLGKLKSLNLAGNNFTTADRVNLWETIGASLRQSPFPLDEDRKYTTEYLQSLNSTTTRLDLSGLILDDPTALETIMPQVVGLFQNLRELDLSNNNIFDVNNNTPIIGGIKALTTYLPQITYLQSLRMSDTSTNIPGLPISVELIRFSEIIGQLPNLQVLDFSGNQFLFASSLGKSLENIHSLTSINLSRCWGSLFVNDTWHGGVQLMNGLGVQTNLTHLDLSSNLIGHSFSDEKDPNSTLALAKALHSWPELQFLNLGNNVVGGSNDIGYQDPASATIFLENLANLTTTIHNQGRTLQVDFFNGIDTAGIEWTKNAGLLQTLTQKQIEDACALEICTGVPISDTTSSQPQARGLTPEVATSDAISSHDIPWYSPARWVTAWKSWWNAPKPVIDMTKPHMGDLVKLRDECDLLISQADLKTADEWYRRSLEDLREDVEEMINKPVNATESAINRFYNRLKGIGPDFLKKPMLKKQSFFASSNPIDNPMQDSRNMIELALPVSMPLLQSGPVPLALGY